MPKLRPISTVTTLPVPTFEEQWQARKQLLPKLREFAMMGAEIAPGSGEYLAAQDTLQAGREAERALSEGRYGDALKAYGMGATASLGTIPLLGGVLKGIKGAGSKIPARLIERYGEIGSKLGDIDKTIVSEGHNFRKWFGDSKVVDSDGKPLVVYHGTNAGFESFAPSPKVDDLGFHFGTQYQAEARLENTAQRKADSAGRGFQTEMEDYAGSRVMPVHLSIQNPLLLPDAGMWDANSISTILEIKKGQEDNRLTPSQIRKIREIGKSPRINRTVKLKEYLKFLGYDGIQYRNKHEGGGTSYIAFEPTQIKSIFNRGTFDPNDPNISAAINPRLLPLIAGTAGAGLGTYALWQAHKSGREHKPKLILPGGSGEE